MNARVGESSFLLTCLHGLKTELVLCWLQKVKNQEHLKSICLLSDFSGFLSTCFLFAPCDCCCDMMAVTERKEIATRHRAAARLLMRWLLLFRCSCTKLITLEASSSDVFREDRDDPGGSAHISHSIKELGKIPCEPRKCW